MRPLLSLFLEILNHTYTKVENDGSFAIDIEGTHLTIYFQQSDGLTDWEHNLDFPAVPYRDMPEKWRCHRGFLKVWKSIEPYLIDIINDNKIESATVCGYSHGAALAFLCHEYIWFNRPDLRSRLNGYGYGGPRVLWGQSIPRERWKNFIRVCNTGDIVTRLPPKLLGYRHAGKPLYIGERGKYNKVTAHMPESYITELEIAGL